MPTRTTVRTVVQTAAALALLVPVLVDELGLPATVPWVAGALAVAAAVTRIMQVPAVQRWLGALRTDRPDDGVATLARRDRGSP
ncbi:hypothetical protein ACGRHY_14420 [Streptomyces sp. HK10]|uniref:hypothetical protein n=1 Tax=Streptomyces sp. HK10 TaxID=3373255 RepID=UPI003747C305